jgi:hypothetical protein
MDYSNFKIDFIGPIKEGSGYHDVKVWEGCVSLLFENNGYVNLSGNNKDIHCKSLVEQIDVKSLIELPRFESGFNWQCGQK